MNHYTLALVLAHLCGDLLSYSAALAEAKRSRTGLSKVSAIAVHCLIHFVFVVFWLWVMEKTLIVMAACYIFVAHFAIDFTRVTIERVYLYGQNVLILKRKEVFLWLIGRNNEGIINAFMEKHLQRWVALNLVDQSLHIVTILIFVNMTNVD